MSEPSLSPFVRSPDPEGRWEKTTTPRMHYNSAGRGAVHSGSPSLPGTRGKAFLNVMLETEAFRSRRSFPRLTVNLWVERAACLRLSGRERSSTRRTLLCGQPVSPAGPDVEAQPGVGWPRPGRRAGGRYRRSQLPFPRRRALTRLVSELVSSPGSGRGREPGQTWPLPPLCHLPASTAAPSGFP